MKINEKIKFIRELKGWSQEEMAEKLHMSMGAYSNIERGETNIQFSRLEQISKILGMKISELTDLESKNVQIVYENSLDNQSQVIFNASDGELHQTIAQQQKEISYLKQEIAYLKEIISLKSSNPDSENS
ncbi:helix-turn-helix transcriptional regulator [Candidatus Halobeggiatoa sp. HSG11]|nr:helix-turn-helix transcriptional regulator [Candidatus Halobeggiatoa sp. HSG11]